MGISQVLKYVSIGDSAQQIIESQRRNVIGLRTLFVFRRETTYIMKL